jgi:putative inorganic carbon (hco3(-)) transporter
MTVRAVAMTQLTQATVAVGRLLLPVVLVAGLAVMVRSYETPVVLGALLGALVLATLFALPQLATLGVIFLLYSNAPAVAVLHGAPRIFAGAVILAFGIPLADRLINRRERAQFDRVFALMLAFLGVLLLASLGARDKVVAIDRVVTFATEGLLLYWLFVNTVTSRVMLRRVMWCLLAAGSFLGSLSIYQAATGSYDQQFAGFAERQLELEFKRERDVAAGTLEDRMYRADRAEGPQIGANRYAQIMVVLVPLAILLARLAPTRRRRVLALAAGGIILTAIALTYSRGGMLALVVLACLSTYAAWLRPRHVLIGALIAVLLLPALSPSVYKRIASLGEVTALSDPGTDGSLRGRATEMLAAVHVFADYPALGVGPGQYAPFYSVEYQQIPGIRFRDIQKSRRAHSLYFEIAAETGVIGLAVFLAIPLMLLRALWRARRQWLERDRELAETAAALWLSLSGFLFTALFMSHAFERYYWLLVALAAAALHIMRAHAAVDAAAPAQSPAHHGRGPE